MTGPEFSEVDIDLLADYVGGALDGTPGEAAVAALIAEDPAWGAAHDELTDGMSAVAAELRALTTGPMPPDIAVRLTAALADLPTPKRPDSSQPDGGASDRGASDRDAPPVGVPAAADTGSGARRITAVGETHRRRTSKRAGAYEPGRRRWLAPVAAAAAVLMMAGIGFGSLLTGSADPTSDTASTAGGAPAAQRNAPDQDSSRYEADSGSRSAGGLAVLPDANQITASGVDYRPDSLADDLARTFAGESTEKRGATSAASRVFVGDTPSGLERLNDRTALADCLAAIAGENGGGAITVRTIDYARYLGDPALVVRFTAGNGSWTWVSGSACGTSGAAAATLNQVKVG